MGDILSELWATPGLLFLCATMGIAGIVRGFSGFGTALIFVPVANIYLTPQEVIGVISLSGLASTSVLFRSAWATANRVEVGWLSFAAIVAAPLGLWLLEQVDASVIRWTISAIAGGTLLALVTGWRFSGHVSLYGVLLIGVGAGVMGGMTGLTGPLVILFYLAGRSAAAAVRGNTILFLGILDFALIGYLWVQDRFTVTMVILAVAISIPYVMGIAVGKRLFHPDREVAYRRIAYAVIAGAVLTGLPIW